MKKIFYTLILFVGFALSMNAQTYNSAVGLRLGYPTSVSYKMFLNETSAVEAYGGFRSYSTYSAINANAAYLLHSEISSVEGLNWYYGGGAGVYIYRYGNSYTGNTNGGVGFNLSGYLGLEYTFEDLPLSASIDWVPTVILTGGRGGFGADSGALAVRYIIGR